MSSSTQVLIFGTTVTSMCIFGAIALSFAPGHNDQAVSVLLGTALPSGIAATAGAFQSVGKQPNDSVDGKSKS